MIDLKVYNLIYYRITDGQKFHVRRASSTDYVLINSETNEKIFRTQSYLRKEFVSDSFIGKAAKVEGKFKSELSA